MLVYFADISDGHWLVDISQREEKANRRHEEFPIHQVIN